jgi:hypothetical protein
MGWNTKAASQSLLKAGLATNRNSGGSRSVEENGKV